MINKLIGVIVTAATVVVIVFAAINRNQHSSLVPFFRNARTRQTSAAQTEKSETTAGISATGTDTVAIIPAAEPAAEPAENLIGIIPPAGSQPQQHDSTAVANIN